MRQKSLLINLHMINIEMRTMAAEKKKEYYKKKEEKAKKKK
ncbi:MAG: hypothetical protein QXO54_05460 [Candidatus Methanomethylicaceae archaeon]